MNLFSDFKEIVTKLKQLPVVTLGRVLKLEDEKEALQNEIAKLKAQLSKDDY